MSKSKRVRSLLSVPLLLLAIVGATVFSAPPAFSAVPSVVDTVAEGLPSSGGDADTATPGAGGTVLSPADGAATNSGDPPWPLTPGDDSAPPPALDPNVPPDAAKGYYVRVFLSEQVVRVYLDGLEIRSMICSSGTTEKPTPSGRFHIQNRGEFFFAEKYLQGGKWWVSFKDWGTYLFHSVPTNRYGEIIPEEAAKLGQPASHGCIRLALDDSKWFYDTIPTEAPVDIG